MNYPKKLDLNARLLSTKRPHDFNSKGMHDHMNSKDDLGKVSERVPFSWEIIPGKPKEMQKKDMVDDDIVLPPKPPPGKWYLSKQINDHGDYGRDLECDGDLDDDDDDEDDVLSLWEAIDFDEKTETANETANGLSSHMVESLGDHSPNFMIQRFLPDANALAAASSSTPALVFPKNRATQLPHSTKFLGISYPESRTGDRSHSSTLGFGIDKLFQWRSHMKPKPCSIKSPVVKCMADPKPQSRRKHASQH